MTPSSAGLRGRGLRLVSAPASSLPPFLGQNEFDGYSVTAIAHGGGVLSFTHVVLIKKRIILKLQRLLLSLGLGSQEGGRQVSGDNGNVTLEGQGNIHPNRPRCIPSAGAYFHPR